MRYEKVIFCSNDCTYRAPVAAEILRKTLQEKSQLTDIAIEAKGITVMFPEPVNGKALAIGKSKGYNLEKYVAASISNTDFHMNTLVFVMTDIDKTKLYDRYIEAINVYTIKEYLGMSGDIEMPFGLSLAKYGENFNRLEELVCQLADKLIYINN